MPPAGALIGAALAGVVAGISAATVAGLTALTAALIGFGTFVLNLAGSILTQSGRPSFDLPSFSGFGSSASQRTQLVRTAITNQRAIVGEALVSGALTFMEQTESNRDHHYCITLVNHEVEAIGTIFVNDVPIYDDDLDNDGWVTRGRYKNALRFKKHLGLPDQVADPDLIAAVDYLDENFRGRGVCYLYVLLRYSRSTFPNGIPNFKCLIRGAKVYDPRSATTSWQPNPSLCTRWYFTDQKFGLGAPTTKIDDVTGNASANICDEIVDTKTVAHAVLSVDASGNTIDLDEEKLKFERGDRVEVSTTGTLPTGIAAATSYYVIPVHERARDDDDDDEFDVFLRIQLASTYLGALAGTAIEITDAGTGTHTVTKTGEPRYTCNGVLESDRRPADILKDLYSSMGALTTFAGGKWRSQAAAWVEPDAKASFDESHFTGPLDIATKVPRSQRSNARAGLYVSSINDWEPTDYPQWVDATAVAADGGTKIVKSLNLPLTNRSAMSQRLAKIDQQRERRETTVQVPCKLTGLRVQAGSTCTLSKATRGWVNKTFQLVSWGLDTKKGATGDPVITTKFTCRETDSAVYAWDALTEENETPPAKSIRGSKVFSVQPPGLPDVSESLYNTRTGAGVKAQATVTWARSPDAFVDQYLVEFKLTSSQDWQEAGPRRDETSLTIFDIAPGIYDFGVTAFNTLGVPSARQVTTKEIFGLPAPPTEPQNVTIRSIGGLALIDWDPLPDLDVQEGGEIFVRHSSALVGATWETSSTIGTPVPGKATAAQLPLKKGTYLLKSRDSSGVLSVGTASVTTKQATALQYGNLATISEHTVFAGTKTNTVAPDGALKLAGSALVDTWLDFDAVLNVDAEGGVQSSGTYDFAAGFDFGAVVRRRLTTELQVVVFDVFDLFDSRTTDIDTWSDFDGAVGGEADVTLWVSETDDDPNGSPNWGPWQRIEVTEVEARGLRFQARLTSTDPAVNIRVPVLSIHAEAVQ